MSSDALRKDTSGDDDTSNDEDGNDDSRHMASPSRRPEPTERKRRQHAAFESWLEKNQREVTKKYVSRLQYQPGEEPCASKKIISSPREYQLDLFERAKERNTIVVLDTGSGKTLIAALLLRYTLERELECRSQGQPHKTAFFVVEKVALCFQQHDVLSCNLEYPIGKAYGEMVGTVRSQSFWDGKFAENMAIVCTAQILLGLLDCGFIHMSRINLLIFDEAHHTKKNHPYAKIIKNHYLLGQDAANRPRILGMTASPVDARVDDVQFAAAELEAMLCSQIATVSDEVLLQGHARQQQSEIQVVYGKLAHADKSRTALWNMMADNVGDNPEFESHLEFARQASSTLGAWCSDHYWNLLMTKDGAAKLEAKTWRDFANNIDPSRADEAAAAVQRAEKIVREFRFQAISKNSSHPWLSTKVTALYDVLEDMFSRKEAKRCIVFVQARSTAFLLNDLFQQPGMQIPDMRTTLMAGATNTGGLSSTISMTLRDQVLALQKFRRGEANCLFATSVAEEGIDIPECDVIVRFDLFASAIQHIQSKGRARQASSVYINMMEEGNVEHRRRVKQAFRDANALRRFCSALPEDRKLQDYVIDAEAMARHELVYQKALHIEETGARLTPASSLEVLAKFVASLPGHDQSQHVEYLVTSLGKRYVARVIFPTTSPIKTAVGEPQRNKQLARCSAAFEACVELIGKKYIDAHLQPKFAAKLPKMRNARLAIKSDQKSEYEMRLKPDFWTRGLEPTPPTQLFPTVIRLTNPEALCRASRPLMLLTRCPLPQGMPAIPLFFAKGQSSVVQLLSSPAPLNLTPERLEALAAFTLRLFSDIFSKVYSAGPAEIPYYIAPPFVNGSREGNPAGEETQVDWTLLALVQQNGELSWEDGSEGLFRNRLAVDPWDGSRKFVLHGINPHLKPSDPTPSGVPEPKSRAYRKVEQTIKEYSNSLSVTSRQRQKWRDDQPVLNAELLSTRRNFLDEFLVEEIEYGPCYVIPEPLRLSPIPMDIVSTALLLPVIMYRIDNTLLALEACSHLGLSIGAELALEAMTKDSFNTEEHGQAQLLFQAGMGKNYERLEFLGDTFLKMATTISVFTLLPDGNEFEYHVERMLMVCNQNLFQGAISEQPRLEQYIRSKAFDRRAWYPAMALRRGKAGKTHEKHCLSHKSIADVCEALIGAAYMSYTSSKDEDISKEGVEMDVAVKAVTRMVKNEKHDMTAFREYYAAFKEPEWHRKPATAAQRLNVDKVAEAIGYRFRSAPLLRSAFRHPSYPYEAVPDYQRLEFLGDALLDMMVVDFLFKRFPDADPRWLTEHKMVMASNHFLGCLCVKLGLHKHILVTHSGMLGDVREYVGCLEQAEEAARWKSSCITGGSTLGGDVGGSQGVREAQNQPAPRAPRHFWTDTAHPPKVLADVLEAVVGAMFVDSRYDMGVVQSFFREHVRAYFEDMSLYDSFAGQHPVTALTQLLREKFGCRSWRLHVASIPPAMESGVAVVSESDVVCALTVHERVVFDATAKNGSAAKVAVSRLAVSKYSDMDAGLFQMETGCDCGGGSWQREPAEG